MSLLGESLKVWVRVTWVKDLIEPVRNLLGLKDQINLKDLFDQYCLDNVVGLLHALGQEDSNRPGTPKAK
jgi:hypothetical protein